MLLLLIIEGEVFPFLKFYKLLLVFDFVLRARREFMKAGSVQAVRD